MHHLIFIYNLLYYYSSYTVRPSTTTTDQQYYYYTSDSGARNPNFKRGIGPINRWEFRFKSDLNAIYDNINMSYIQCLLCMSNRT